MRSEKPCNCICKNGMWKCNTQKHQSIAVLRNNTCSENVLQIYRRAPMPKCGFQLSCKKQKCSWHFNATICRRIPVKLHPSAWKMSKYRLFSGPYFPVFNPNTRKYWPEKTPYLETFHEVLAKWVQKTFTPAFVKTECKNGILHRGVLDILTTMICRSIPVRLRPYQVLY